MTAQTWRNLAIAGVVALGVLYLRYAVIGDTRWWNLLMAAMLVALLVRYLSHQRRRHP